MFPLDFSKSFIPWGANAVYVLHEAPTRHNKHSLVIRFRSLGYKDIARLQSTTSPSRPTNHSTNFTTRTANSTTR